MVFNGGDFDGCLWCKSLGESLNSLLAEEALPSKLGSSAREFESMGEAGVYSSI